MHTFEDIKPGARLRGLDPAGIVEVVVARSVSSRRASPNFAS